MMRFSFDRFDIVRLVRGVIASCEILVQQAEAVVDFVADDCLYVWADEFKTEQVVRNYLTNAIHHVEKRETDRGAHRFRKWEGKDIRI